MEKAPRTVFVLVVQLCSIGVYRCSIKKVAPLVFVKVFLQVLIGLSIGVYKCLLFFLMALCRLFSYPDSDPKT